MQLVDSAFVSYFYTLMSCVFADFLDHYVPVDQVIAIKGVAEFGKHFSSFDLRDFIKFDDRAALSELKRKSRRPSFQKNCAIDGCSNLRIQSKRGYCKAHAEELEEVCFHR